MQLSIRLKVFLNLKVGQLFSIFILQADYGGLNPYHKVSNTLNRLTTRSSSVQQVNLANLRASTIASSVATRATLNPRPSTMGAPNTHGSFLVQKTPTINATIAASAAQRAQSARRLKTMLDLESIKNIPTPTPTRNIDQRLLDINPAGKKAAQ